MSFNIEVRKKQLQSLDQYITSSRDRVLSILNYLGWNSSKILKNEEQHVCPINHSHRIPLEKMDKHIQKCCLKSAGYNLDDDFLSEVPENKGSSITLGTPTKIDLLNAARQKNPKFTPAWNGVDPDPMTSDRLLSTFSPDERLTMYEYCAQNTVGPPTPSEFCVDVAMLGKDEKKDGPLSKEELLEQERNAKRRRIKYKAVHTGRSKSYKEVMRQVIENQMEIYKEFLTSQEERSRTAVEDFEQVKDYNGHSTQNFSEYPSTQTLDSKETYEHVQDFYTHSQMEYQHDRNVDKVAREDKHDKTFREEDRYDKYNRTSREEEKYDRSVRDDKHDRSFRDDKYDRPVREDKYNRTFREDKYERTFKEEDKHDKFIRDDKYNRSFRDEDKYEKSYSEEKQDRSLRNDKYDRPIREQDKYSDRNRDYKEKSSSYRRHGSSYERSLERREPYHRSKYRH